MFKFISILLFFLGSHVFAAQNIILVPGFFSSAIPSNIQIGNGSPWDQPYFSPDVVAYLQRSGGRLWVVDNLNPLGSVEENGQRLISFLKLHQKEMAGGPLLFIAHSAGGLYSLYAAAHSDFAINRIIAVGTPFQGLDFLKPLEDHLVPVDLFLKYFYLKNLVGLKPDYVRKFLTQLQLKHPVRVDAFAGSQPIGIAFWDYQNLSDPLIPLQLLNNQSSDGVVTVQSALGIGFYQGRIANLDAHVHTDVISLEHWEFILNADFSRTFGVQNILSLKRAQEWAYYQMLTQSR